MSDQSAPGQSYRELEAGWMAGWIAGFGMSGFAWMNPYIALSLLLGGMVLAVVARVAVSHRVRSGATREQAS